jgi:hypothetical protein
MGSQDGSITLDGTYSGDTYHYKNENTGSIIVNKRATSTAVSCSPNTVSNNTTTVCKATVTDTDVSTPITPTGSILFSSNSTGTFSSPSCPLAATGNTRVANCSVAYTPSVGGHHMITASYQTLDNWGIWEPGDYFHNGSTGTVIASATTSDPSLTINRTVNFQGITVTISGGISITSGTVSGTISVTATNSTTGALLFSKTYTISNLPMNNNQAKFLLNIAVSPYPLSADIIVSANGGVWNAILTVTRQIDLAGDGNVDMIDMSTIALSYDSSRGSPAYNPNADIFAVGTVDLVDVATAAIFYGAASYS